MGSVGAAIEIFSDDEEIQNAGESPEDALKWASQVLLEDCTGIGDGLYDSVAIQKFLASPEDKKKSLHAAAAAAPAAAGDDGDDCIVLDGDPYKTVVVAKERRSGEDVGEEELQIVAEKGELACRDFPHPRHLCASFPFSTSSHAKHCAMCHCYVCDSSAPCAKWGKGTYPTDHCHATDKDAKWKQMRQSSKCKSLPASNRGSIQNFFCSSSTAPSSLQYTGHLVVVPQSIPPLRPNVIRPVARRVPVASTVSQNQQMHPSIGVAQNVGQAVHVPKASTPRPKISRKSFKRVGAAPPVYTPSNANKPHPAVPNHAPMQSASSHAFQAAQVAPLNNIIAGTFQGCPPQGYPPQHSHSAPIVYQRFQVQSTAYLQGAPNRAVGTGMQPFQCPALPTRGTRCLKDPSADRQKEWEDVLANLASELGVPDYNVNPPHGQQFASTQFLQGSLLLEASQGVEPNRSSVAAASQMWPSNAHLLPSHKSGDGAQSLQRSLLIAQLKASQGIEPIRSSVAATSQMRPCNGHLLLSHKSGDGALAYGSMQTTQPLCLLNSESSLTPK